MRKLAATAILISAVVPRSADACSMPGPEPFNSSSTSMNTVAPVLDRAEVASIKRGVGPRSEGCGRGESATSCDDIGSIELAVAAHDDEPGEVGFAVELAAGALPSGVTLPTEPIRAREGRLTFAFLDGATDDQEAFTFTLRIAAVDAANNRSAARTVVVSHEGTGGGCGRIAPRGGLSPAIALMIIACLLGRRAVSREG